MKHLVGQQEEMSLDLVEDDADLVQWEIQIGNDTAVGDTPLEAAKTLLAALGVVTAEQDGNATCPSCNGAGDVDAPGITKDVCGRCDGTGKVEKH